MHPAGGPAKRAQRDVVARSKRDPGRRGRDLGGSGSAGRRHPARFGHGSNPRYQPRGGQHHRARRRCRKQRRSDRVPREFASAVRRHRDAAPRAGRGCRRDATLQPQGKLLGALEVDRQCRCGTGALAAERGRRTQPPQSARGQRSLSQRSEPERCRRAAARGDSALQRRKLLALEPQPRGAPLGGESAQHVRRRRARVPVAPRQMTKKLLPAAATLLASLGIMQAGPRYWPDYAQPTGVLRDREITALAAAESTLYVAAGESIFVVTLADHFRVANLTSRLEKGPLDEVTAI